VAATGVSADRPWLRDEDDTTRVVLRQWTFDGIGWLTSGDAAFAASAAARAREHREAARLTEPHPDLD
jgi:hypothetical protein